LRKTTTTKPKMTMNKKENKSNRYTHGSSCLGCFFVKRNLNEKEKRKEKKEQSTPQTTQKKE
jgi:hypothetical protein